jgi:acyl carrier protein
LSLDRDQLIAFFADTFQLDRRVLSGEMPLFSSALLDSASLVNLVAFLEEKTGLVVEADDVTLDNFDTISAILSFCEARLG